MLFENYSVETLNIFERSSTWFERRSMSWDYQMNNDQEQQFTTYLLHWKNVLSKTEGEKRFERFLEFENISDAELRKMLSKVKANAATELPSWLNILEEIKNHYHSSQTFVENNPEVDFQKIPFYDVLYPMVLIYRKEVEKTLQNYQPWIREEVRTNFEKSYLALISKTAGRVLYNAFHYFREVKKVDLDEAKSSERSNTIYLQFASEMLDGGFFELILQYPVLGRILSVLTLNLAKANARCLNRFIKDRSEIEQYFFPKEKIGKLKKVETSISDRHKDGEGVVILTFENDAQLVYKPKNLDLAENYDQLSAWINAKGFEPNLKRSKLINKKTYGWVEFIPFLECKTQKEIKLYYQRAGSLLGLLHLLRATDCHYENVIASGNFPAIVDFETLLQPDAKPVFQKNISQNDIEKFYKKRDGVMRTLLLPSSLDYQTSNIGGLGGVNPQEPVAILRCLNPNTDQMNVAKILHDPIPEKNVPQLENKTVRVQHHGDELKEGFQKFYQFLMNNKKELVSDSSPLKRFENLPERYIFRSTYIYGTVLDILLNPKFLGDGIVYSIQLEMLAKAGLKTDNKPNFWLMIDEERRAMMNQDIPFFMTSTNTKSLKMKSKNLVIDFFEKPSYQAMIDHLVDMNEEDLAFQLDQMDKSVGSKKETEHSFR